MRVVQYDLSGRLVRVHVSQAQAARADGITSAALSKAFRKGEIAASGFSYWLRLDEPDQPPSTIAPPPRRAVGEAPPAPRISEQKPKTIYFQKEGARRRVVGVYPSVQAAAASVGVTRQAILKAAKTGARCQGYYWSSW
jgi:hypothetical protein